METMDIKKEAVDLPSSPLSNVSSSLSSVISAVKEGKGNHYVLADNHSEEDNMLELSSGSIRNTSADHNGDGDDDDDKDLSSLDSLSASAPRFKSTGADDICDHTEELELVGELREIEKTLQLTLNKIEKCYQDGIRKERWNNGIPNGKQKPSPPEELQSKHKLIKFNNPVELQESLLGAVSIATISDQSSSSSVHLKESERERQLKRKLEMVTDQLSLSRMGQAKKIRKATSRSPMCIEVPDFPMEYYQIKTHSIVRCGLLDWYHRFNRHIRLQQPSEYYLWVQQRVIVSLPEVLKVMCTVWNPNSDVGINGLDLLTCRLVSKSWKLHVDKFLQQHSRDSIVKNGSMDLLAYVTSTKINSFKYEKFVDFVHLCLASQQQPFPIKNLIIFALPLKKIEATLSFKDAMQILMDHYGKEVERFTFQGYPEGIHTFFNGNEKQSSTILNNWATLRRWLEKMPNLSRLKISLPYHKSLEVELLGMKLDISNQPFPSLKKLTSVQFEHVPVTLVNSIMKNNEQIKTIKLAQFQGEVHPNWNEYKHRVSEMTEIFLNNFKIHDLQSLQEANWPLRKIVLSLDRTEYFHLGQVFQILESFRETLSYLSLRILIERRSGADNLTLELPHLENLSLFLMENEPNVKRISYDFLLPLTSLQTLRISLEGESDATDKPIQMAHAIQLRGYIARLYDSNIWKLFPYLKKVNATGYYGQDKLAKQFLYTRKEKLL